MSLVFCGKAQKWNYWIMLLFSQLVVSDSLDCNNPSFPVLHYLPEFAQILVHWVSGSIQSSHPLSPPFPPAVNLSLFILFMEFSRQEYWSGLPFPSPVDQVLSELSTITHPSWVALHSMAHSFIELDKAVVHVISLVSFLWLWFSVFWPSDGEG